MLIDIHIDKLTPCLIEVSTGKILQTTFSVTSYDDISSIAENGWLFDWTDEALRTTNIYKLHIKDDDTIQGLIAAEVIRGAVYVHLVESAPHNRGAEKQFVGVGGHLFAIAIKLSVENGFDGYTFFEAKTLELANHYAETLGATRVPSRIHSYRMEILEDVALNIINKYTLEGDLNVKRKR